MKTRLGGAIVCAVITAATPMATAEPKAPAKPAAPRTAQITAIHAFSYFHDSGTLGTTDLTVEPPGMNLPDSENEASVSTLVQVEVALEDPMNPAGDLQVEVFADKKKQLSQKVHLQAYRGVGSTKRVLPYFIYDTGCQDLTINARLTTGEGKATKTQKKTATIRFMCGE